MNLMVYCQHVLGIGHLCRIMLILEQLRDHRITLVLGGPRVDIDLPDHVRVVQLPGLRMDEEFSGLLPVDVGQDTTVIKEQRTRLLLEVFNDLQPDLLLLELFPFGRNAFRFELLPLLKLSREQLNDVIIKAYHKWDNTIRFIDAIDPGRNSIITDGGKMKPWNPLRRDARYHLENFRAAMDSPGEISIAGTESSNSPVR